jgi:hypothetical protein
MLIATTWEQSPYYDPTNPNQQVREAMVGTGGDRGYASFYWNQVKPTSNIQILSPSGGGMGALGEGLQHPFKLAGIGVALAAAAGLAAFTFSRGRKRRR